MIRKFWEKGKPPDKVKTRLLCQLLLPGWRADALVFVLRWRAWRFGHGSAKWIWTTWYVQKKNKKTHFDTWSSQLAFRAHLQTRTWIPVRVAHICSSHSLLNQSLRKRKSLLLSPSAPAPPPFPRAGADRQDVGWQSLKHPVWLHTSHTTSNSIMPLDYTHVLHPAENHLVKPDSLSLTFMCYISTCASEFRMSFGFDL